MAISTKPRSALAALLLAGAPSSVPAAPLSLPGSLPNMAGLGIGSTTEFAGGKGRNDVDDPVVSRLHEIDTTVEAGGYLGYEYLNQGRVPWRLGGGVNVMTNAGIVYGGMHIAATGSLWVPLHPRVYAGVGLGAAWVSGSFNCTYFGVTPSDSAASGLPVYSPGGGLEQFTGWLALLYGG